MESIDRSAAEEALLIAARMQHEHRERLSVSQLKSTAAEVDIAPEFVDQALEVMRQRELVVEPVSPVMKRGDFLTVANLVVIQTAFAVVAFYWREFPLSPPVLIALTAAAIAGSQTPKTRRTKQILTYSVIFSVIAVAICESFARQSFERTMITAKSMSLLLFEVAIFLVVQYLKSRSTSKTGSSEQRFQANY